jgi:glutamyl-tRNA reductase
LLPRKASATGIALNRLFQKAFAAAKHIRTDTAIARGSTSVGNVAVDLAQQIFRTLAPCTIMVVGTGEMSEATAKALRSRGAGTILVCSRTHERAESLAGQLAGQAISYEDWPEHFPSVDIVISATAAPHPIITREKLIPLMKARRQRPLFLIDIAVPRDVERPAASWRMSFCTTLTTSANRQRTWPLATRDHAARAIAGHMTRRGVV